MHYRFMTHSTSFSSAGLIIDDIRQIMMSFSHVYFSFVKWSVNGCLYFSWRRLFYI